MATYIKPTISVSANKNSTTNTADKGPLSIPLSITSTDKLSVDNVRSSIVTIGTTAAILLDGSTLTGTDTATEAGVSDSATHGGFLYLKNVSTSSTTKFIYVGIDHDGGGTSADDISDADQVDDFSKVTRLMTLKTGEFAWLPFDYTMDIYIDASHADQKLEYWLFDRA